MSSSTIVRLGNYEAGIEAEKVLTQNKIVVEPTMRSISIRRHKRSGSNKISPYQEEDFSELSKSAMFGEFYGQSAGTPSDEKHLTGDSFSNADPTSLKADDKNVDIYGFDESDHKK
jgi:hypothetical protein